jgi:pilus assembly protein CpaC
MTPRIRIIAAALAAAATMFAAPATSFGQGAPIASDAAGQAEIGPTMNLTIGKSTLVRLPAPIDRISVGNPAVTDVTLISPRELYLLGKAFGSTNVIMWRKNAPTTIIDVNVAVDVGTLEQRIRELLPNEKAIRVSSAADSVVLSGTVSSAAKADTAARIAEAYVRTFSRGITLPIGTGDQQAAPGQTLQVGQVSSRSDSGDSGGRGAGVRIVNMLEITSHQQVMIEVKVAEVSKNLLDKLGVGINASGTSGDWRYGIISEFLSLSNGVLGIAKGNDAVTIDAEKRDGLVRVLAEPNIVSISGQEASFLAGGKIFIPTARTNQNGAQTFDLTEKEYGVGLKFTPTVLDGDLINLRVAPEVSELSQTGSPFVAVNGATAVLPSFTTRRAQTTVQLRDGQSFAIAGLIKNNVSETIKRFPLLGDLPVIGALFRSSEFQTDRTELMFIVTPRLVKPTAGPIALPTDNFVPPSRTEFFLEGKLEGSGHPDVPMAPAPVSPAASAKQPAAGGYQLK